MEKFKTNPSFRTLVVLAAAAAICLIGLAGAAGTQAALVYESNEYAARIAQTHLGVALVEQSGEGSEPVVVNVGDEGKSYLGSAAEGAEGNLLPTTTVTATKDGETTTAERAVLLGDDEQMIPGKAYTEKLFARNASSDMAQYVRLTVRKYWTDAEGNKLYDVDPALIVLGETGDGWVKSESESNDERLVFYYATQLGQGETTSAAIESIMLDPAVLTSDQLKAAASEQAPEYRITLQADVDAVQTKHAAEAAKSAWGIDITALGLNW